MKDQVRLLHLSVEPRIAFSVEGRVIGNGNKFILSCRMTWKLLYWGGPLALNETEIHEMYARGVKIVTLNGAYNWALSKGMTVGAQIVVDARPFNARFTHPVNDKTRYLIGSQCDPSVLEGLPKDRTYLWHTTAEQITDILKERYGDEWFGIVGGCTVLLRAIPLLRMLGYKRFHLFGCDSSVSPGSYNGTRTEEWKTYTHHAYKQAENNDAPLFLL